jgi:hypothetical protein
MDITNKTTKPLSVPLPGGKKLFLAPGKTGQVTSKALEHAPIVKLIEAGDIETAGDGAKPRQGGGRNSGSSGGSRNSGSGAMRQSGDR